MREADARPGEAPRADDDAWARRLRAHAHAIAPVAEVDVPELVRSGRRRRASRGLLASGFASIVVLGLGLGASALGQTWPAPDVATVATDDRTAAALLELSTEAADDSPLEIRMTREHVPATATTETGGAGADIERVSARMLATTGSEQQESLTAAFAAVQSAVQRSEAADAAADASGSSGAAAARAAAVVAGAELEAARLRLADAQSIAGRTAGDRYVSMIERSYTVDDRPVDDPPAVDLVEAVTFADWPARQAQCLHERGGWDTSSSGSGWRATYDEADADLFGDDMLACAQMYPVDVP